MRDTRDNADIRRRAAHSVWIGLAVPEFSADLKPGAARDLQVVLANYGVRNASRSHREVRLFSKRPAVRAWQRRQCVAELDRCGRGGEVIRFGTIRRG